MTAMTLVDSWTMTRRGLAHWARQPVQVVVDLAFPVMMLLMFAYFLGGGMTVPGGGDYKHYLVPGMLALTMAFGLEATMLAITQDLNKGVIDRFRSLPIASSAVLIGRVCWPHAPHRAEPAPPHRDRARDGLALARRSRGRAERGRAAALLRFAMLWIGIYLGLLAGRARLVQAVQILVWPIGFLSNVFVEPGQCPVGSARSRRGTRCRRRPPRYVTCSRAPGAAARRGPRTTPDSSPSAGRWRSSRSSSRSPWAVTGGSAAEWPAAGPLPPPMPRMSHHHPPWPDADTVHVWGTTRRARGRLRRAGPVMPCSSPPGRWASSG